MTVTSLSKETRTGLLKTRLQEKKVVVYSVLISQEKYLGPPLPLPPFVWDTKSTLALSSVREEQLAILFQRLGTMFIIIIYIEKK